MKLLEAGNPRECKEKKKRNDVFSSVEPEVKLSENKENEQEEGSGGKAGQWGDNGKKAMVCMCDRHHETRGNNG